MPGNCEQRLGIGRDELRELRGLLLYGLGGSAVRAHTEGVGRIDLKQGCGFIECPCNCDVVHMVGPGSEPQQSVQHGSHSRPIVRALAGRAGECDNAADVRMFCFGYAATSRTRVTWSA